jgi:acyl-coenzyme A synthetase/AMP-(fatty) acid ligase
LIILRFFSPSGKILRRKLKELLKKNGSESGIKSRL